MNKHVPAPVIYETGYHDMEDLQIGELRHDVAEKLNEKKVKYIVNYPTVYIIKNKNHKKYKVYVGETNDIRQRTLEHLKVDPKSRTDWKEFEDNKNTDMYVVGHEHFNKSLTLDIENQLMLYLSSVPTVESISNRRNNFQNLYYTSDERDLIFEKIWKKLNRKNNELFPALEVIKDSAIFKASPFHKLTLEQNDAKLKVYEKIKNCMQNDQDGQLILIRGEAGAGKTVLLSNLFYDLAVNDDLDVHLMVNHDQQIKVYESIAEKTGIDKDKVGKPTSFINNTNLEDKVDVVLVDEAHLLLTQGKMSYRGNNQLFDLLDRAKVVVAVFDKNQILSREQIWEEQFYEKMEEIAQKNDGIIDLHNQMRIDASEATVRWIRNFIDERTIYQIPKDNKYELKIAKSPAQLQAWVDEKAQDEKHGISRIVATFDWEYKNKPKKDNQYWNVEIGDWKMPWNLQLPKKKVPGINNKNLSWAEQPQTLGEVGSTFTIQGFDLNYVGVIIGPSVKFRNGQIVFDPSESADAKATQNRTLSNNEKKSFGEELIKNALNVLMTRGVHGMFIYAVDEKLQEELLKAEKGI